MESRYGTGVDRSPSFSSTLLDSICRSFDHSGHVPFLQTGEACSNGGHRSVITRVRGVREVDGGRPRDRIVDKWMEKTTTEFVNRRSSIPAVKIKPSSMSSSDSSSGFGFSSSDADSISGNKKSKSLKPIRTTVSSSETKFQNSANEILYRKKRHSDGRKTAAMRIYGELKRIKKPISPGGKVASFLNSLFSPRGNGKNQRISTSMPATSTITTHNRETSNRSESESNSYTRSCLNKFQASSGEKRSVRFCTLDRDLKGGTSRRNSKSEMELALRVVDSNKKSMEEAAKALMKNYYKKWELDGAQEMEKMEDQEDVEDVESCCSSDLFELENLMEIGVDVYSAELPVYETTHVHTNRAIASGFIN